MFALGLVDLTGRLKGNGSGLMVHQLYHKERTKTRDGFMENLMIQKIKTVCWEIGMTVLFRVGMIKNAMFNGNSFVRYE